ncbi:esterase [Streptacidiphilus sp. PB12-B1b]|uniref:alpha/beta hydrolase n=1 Tax=Streptacidiphilus sp. PB12-B1b TaxID=2705012 RepID=UPI0015FDC6E0|nr:alpha/beta hydrolase-fold protein [Streptacidiphilus sp. PB12-B1b]QMU74902.1 esterase [Streptacidiphilus sp. PB12-B1b]
MDLTSSTLLDAVIALTVVSVALTVWLWPRLARRGVLWILARLGMILMSQLSLVLVVALMINSYGDFYPTWDDLVGGGNNQQVAFGQTTGADNGNTAVSAGSHGLITTDTPGDLNRWHDLPSGPADQVGQVSSVHIHGVRTKISDHAYVFLPPQYFQPAYAHTDFPVITAYTGFPGEIETLLDHLKTIQQFSSLEQSGQIQPTILVLISQNVTMPRDNDCVNIPHGPQVETFLTSDYQTAMHATYRVAADPRAWGLEGYSEGGTCALEIAMRYPKLYSVVGDLGGDYADTEDAQTGNLFGAKGTPARTQLMNQYNVEWRLKHLPVPPVQVLVATTTKEFDYKATEQFLRAVKAPMSATPLLLRLGGHNFTTWAQEQGPTMVWMSQHMSPPVAETPPPATPRAVPPPATRSLPPAAGGAHAGPGKHTPPAAPGRD